MSEVGGWNASVILINDNIKQNIRRDKSAQQAW
jgi:hypothetical protein